MSAAEQTKKNRRRRPRRANSRGQRAAVDDHRQPSGQQRFVLGTQDIVIRAWSRGVSPAADGAEQAHSHEIGKPCDSLARLLSFGLLAILLLRPCDDSASAPARILQPQPRRSITSRIVSIGGSITEILYALGEQQKIVAVDTTSLYPPSALKEKPNVGYMRQLSAEGVLALSPTLILAIEGSGPKETIDVLEQRQCSVHPRARQVHR